MKCVSSRTANLSQLGIARKHGMAFGAMMMITPQMVGHILSEKDFFSAEVISFQDDDTTS
jgi:hypothetical protein